MAAEKYAKTERDSVAGLARARLLVKLGRNADAAAAFERLVADPERREALAKAGATADALLAEWGWSLVDAAKPAEADRVFSRLLKEYPESPYSARMRDSTWPSRPTSRTIMPRCPPPVAPGSQKPAEPTRGPARPASRQRPVQPGGRSRGCLESSEPVSPVASGHPVSARADPGRVPGLGRRLGDARPAPG